MQTTNLRLRSGVGTANGSQPPQSQVVHFARLKWFDYSRCHVGKITVVVIWNFKICFIKYRTEAAGA